jgi:hypothetical protein
MSASRGKADIDCEGLGMSAHDPLRTLQDTHLSENHRAVVLCRPRASGRGLLTAWPHRQRGLAELMFFRSTPGRMGNLLIPITAPRNQIGLRRFVIWG